MLECYHPHTLWKVVWRWYINTEIYNGCVILTDIHKMGCSMSHIGQIIKTVWNSLSRILKRMQYNQLLNE
jgi:hypothetical protein